MYALIQPKGDSRLDYNWLEFRVFLHDGLPDQV